ncbi:SAM-dependent methyltransferase [Paramagnetospirillum marisnigri]|uniref:SAM-dependent methyltransferase n=1 Tax=Paramagnetospirillum marisnigri TaxID=1285242 RepID=A0A178MQ41_9PROT|nr:FkbM family methyltransferase [Paramagnetospirillum marisnigri]OAN50836.1 SAM-dependent methyltransferase [Paramagnetospirillum marisnigri]
MKRSPRFQPVLPDSLGWCAGRHGPMVFPAKDAYVGRSLADYHEYSEGEVDLFRQMLRPGDTVVEAGANIGALTVPLARLVGPRGRVWAFEPQRPVFGVLCTNLTLNGQEHVRPERVALGEGEGSIKVPVIPMGAEVNFGGLSLGELDGEPCPVRSLDSYGLQSLRLIKADVEGAEVQLILGAKDTIRRLRPLLYMENDRKERSAALIKSIMDLGYRLWWHVVPLFSPNNFAGNTTNIFGAIGSKNMVCIPAEQQVDMTAFTEILGPDAPHPF